MNKRQRIKEIKNEIEWYGVKKRIADAMLKLGEAGFKFSGHGYGLGGEDFSLVGKGLYINFCDQGKKVIASISNNDDEMEDVFCGTIGESLKYLGL